MFDSTRILWGLGLAVAVIFIALIDSFLLNFVIFAVLLFLAFNEAKRLFATPNASAIYALLAFLLASASGEPLACGALLLLLVVGFYAYKKSKNLKEAMPYLYPTLPIFALWQVYLDSGIFVLFWLIFIVVVCDSGAYFIGKLIGSTPFSPSSPKKTREGVVGGVVCATFFGFFVGLAEFNFATSLLVPFVVAVFGVIGDLLESYFKRQSGVKDSGALIPGHGGVLDRIDAIIIAAFAMLALV